MGRGDMCSRKHRGGDQGGICSRGAVVVATVALGLMLGLLLGVSGCATSEAADPLEASVSGQAGAEGRQLLLTESDLPDGWVKAPEQDRSGPASDVAISPQSCARATVDVGAANRAWEQAATDESVVYLHPGPTGETEAELKEEIVRDPEVSPTKFLTKVEALVHGCGQFTAYTPTGDVSGTTTAYDLGDTTGYGLVQQMTSTSGAVATKAYVYLVRGHTLAAITLTISGPEPTISDLNLSAIVEAADTKLEDGR